MEGAAGVDSAVLNWLITSYSINTGADTGCEFTAFRGRPSMHPPPQLPLHVGIQASCD